MNNPPPAPEPVWRKSSYSGNNGGECIECRTDLASFGKVPVRDSKCADGPILTFTTAAFSDFVRATEWDMQPQEYVMKKGHRLGVVLVSTDYDYTLRYPAGTRMTVRAGVSSVTLPVAP